MANASYLRVTKSETRDLADRAHRGLVAGHSEDWERPTTGRFFAAFVVIAALVTAFALVLR
jgi:hypothetical protein